MNRVHIKTYGCQMNERDSDAVSAMLRARGYRIVADENDCDVLLLNTCSVRDAAEQKAIGKAENLSARKKKNPDFILGILGCMAQNRGASLLDQLPDVDLIVGTQKFHQVPDYLDNLRAAREAGHETGIHCYNHYRWQDHLHGMTAAEVAAEFDAARAAYRRIFGEEARTAGNDDAHYRRPTPS